MHDVARLAVSPTRAHARTSTRAAAVTGLVVLAAVGWLVSAQGATLTAAPHDVAAAQLLAAATTGPALFTSTGLVPDRPLSRCLDVTLPGQAPGSTVVLRAVEVVGPLAGGLEVVVESGAPTGAPPGDCTGFVGTTLYSGTLADLATTSASDPFGVPTGWVPADAATRAFRFTVRVDESTQGMSAGADLVWAVTAAPEPPGVQPSGAPATGPTTATPGTTATPATSGTTDSPSTTATPTAVPTDGPTSPTAGPTRPTVSQDEGASGGGTTGADPTSGGLVTQLDLGHRVGAVLTGAARQAGYPAAAVAVVLLFLLVQDQLDRRDPKLAMAPLTEQAPLTFGGTDL